MQITTPAWRPGKKIAFRFLFLLLGLSTLFCWDLLVWMSSFIFSRRLFGLFNPGIMYQPLVKPFYWLDKHIYHTGYNPKIQGSFPGDNHMGVVFYLTLVLVAVLGSIAWSLADRKRPGYNRLSYWFRIYLRYVLAMVIFGYGIDKLIPVQMPAPSAVDLMTTLGDSSRFSVLWNFMGISPGYMMLTGAAEIMGSLLLFNRRTVVAGYLLLTGILINVVAFNFFYNVPVKMFSIQLLLYTLFLLFPYLKKLSQLFFLGQSAAFTGPHYALQIKWKRITLMAFMIGIPLLLFTLNSIGVKQRYNRQQASNRNQKIYDVISFVAKDTLPPLPSDTLRWKRFLFVYTKSAVIYNMHEERDYYDCDVDSNKRTFTLHDNPDTLTWHIFHYRYPAKDLLALSGKWKGQDVQILMKSAPVDSMRINKEKLIWVQD